MGCHDGWTEGSRPADAPSFFVSQSTFQWQAPHFSKHWLIQKCWLDTFRHYWIITCPETNVARQSLRGIGGTGVCLPTAPYRILWCWSCSYRLAWRRLQPKNGRHAQSEAEDCKVAVQVRTRLAIIEFAQNCSLACACSRSHLPVECSEKHVVLFQRTVC